MRNRIIKNYYLKKRRKIRKNLHQEIGYHKNKLDDESVVSLDSMESTTFNHNFHLKKQIICYYCLLVIWCFFTFYAIHFHCLQAKYLLNFAKIKTNRFVI